MVVSVPSPLTELIVVQQCHTLLMCFLPGLDHVFRCIGQKASGLIDVPMLWQDYSRGTGSCKASTRAGAGAKAGARLYELPVSVSRSASPSSMLALARPDRLPKVDVMI